MMPMERLRVAVADRDRQRGRPLTDEERLTNLRAAIERCDRCNAPVKLSWDVCLTCGFKLKDDTP